ncbi:hypothetical protein AB0C65_36495 [Nocardia sp. NPDC048505]|uniref:hypothetical protein n=1 Tax=Nocardia sp. NPDC048505 TaxID=3155756 RepID=UPI0033C27AEE
MAAADTNDSWRRFTSDGEIEAVYPSIQQDPPYLVATLFCEALEDPERNQVALRALVTPESLPAWGDFSTTAAQFSSIQDPGYGSRVDRAFEADDVGYFKILSGVTQSYQVTEGQIIACAAVITLVLHRDTGQWMVHSIGEQVRPEEIPSRTGDSVRWDAPQKRRMDIVPLDAWLTQHGERRADGTFKFTEAPRWERPTYIEFDVSMIEGRATIAEASFARRRMSRVTPRDCVRRFRAADLYDASYMPMRTPARKNQKHVSVYANMEEVESWTPPDENSLIALEANRRWWDRPERITLKSLTIEVAHEQE